MLKWINNHSCQEVFKHRCNFCREFKDLLEKEWWRGTLPRILFKLKTEKMRTSYIWKQRKELLRTEVLQLGLESQFCLWLNCLSLGKLVDLSLCFIFLINKIAIIVTVFKDWHSWHSKPYLLLHVLITFPTCVLIP